MSKAAKRIVDEGLLTEFAGKFMEKSRDYGEGHEFLGVRGQFSDMNRKFQKLKRFMWDNPDDEPVNESLEEILFDMIGHCFLTIDLMRQDRDQDIATEEWAIKKINQILDDSSSLLVKIENISAALSRTNLR